MENAASSAKFKEQALQQEVDLLKRNNEWHESELKTRTTEHTKFRKEKNARISELQRANEDANATAEALKRTEQTLRLRLEELGQKADDAFAKIQQMQEGASKAEESFRVELDSARRLAELQKQSADTAKARLLDLQNNIDQIKENAAEEVGQLQAEIETERADREAVEAKLAELELEVERLQAAASEAQNNVSVLATPKRNSNGLAPSTPGRDGSPALFTPGSARMKGNMSFTQLYSEYSTMKSDLEAEKRRNYLLSNELDEMIRDLENRGPEQEELREEKERVEAEVLEMSSMLDSASAERDEARKEARNLKGQTEGLSREGDILRQQLRDLSAQIKILLVEMQARDQGLEALDAAGQMQLQMLANGELDDSASAAEETSAGALISQRLLLFRNVQELQDQNVQLLKLNRGLADRMEGEAAKAKQSETEQALQELDELRDRVQRHQDEIKSMTTQCESIMRERDMFRRMLSHRGQLPAGTDLQAAFGRSVGPVPSTPPPGGMSRDVEDTPRSKELSDYSKLLKEMQNHFDAYRQEAATDHSTLKQQVDKLAREKGELQGEVARTGGQITLAHERYGMLQANYDMLKSENLELQKRSQSLAEVAAKQDLRTQQVAEELVEARTLADSMRNDTANLKAERELWKKIEARMTEDNRSLMDERSRLNKMIADLQTLQNERELAESETRRRLQNRVEALETEIDATKKKLESEVDESKKAALRREYDQEQSRTRIDDLVKSLSGVREELVAAKTTRDQLQSRVEELKIELRTSEERVQALQPRPTPQVDQPTENNAPAEDALSREQELALEVADLKHDLELARSDLENAKIQVEQYKNISQASEEELQSLNETNDQYREEMDRIIAEKDEKIKDLESRVEELGTELSTTNNELSTLRTQHEENAIQLDDQKRLLEAEIARLRDESERYAETAKLHQEDLKAQAEIAQQAQQSYENELVKHADAAKNLQSVRTEYNQLRTEVAAIKAEAETAKVTLSQSEESWTEVRERYERELTEVRLGREDLKAQNKLLHEQLESVSGQISELQHKKTAPEVEERDSGEAHGSEFENLQEVIKYLRREKEIVDVQYELSTQESKRLQQQLEYAQTQLDETRQKLSEERQQHADHEANTVSHNKLMQTINELNVFRESSTTLRQEARQAQTQLAEKLKEIESLTSQIQPLQTRIQEVENELETKEGEMKLMQEDRDRWRDRTQNIISKYDRVDPAEMEAMKTQISDLQAERDQLTTEKQELQTKVDTVPGELQQIKDDADKLWKEQKARFVEQAKARSREQSAKIKELEKELEGIKEEKEQLGQGLVQVKEELESTKTARDEAVAVAEAASQQVTAQSQAEEGQIQEDGEADASAQALEQSEARASEEAAKAAGLATQVEALQTRISELEGQVVSYSDMFRKHKITNTIQNELQQQLETSAASITELQNQQQPISEAVPESGENTAHLEKLRQELAAAQEEVESLKAAATNTASTDTVSQDAAPQPSDAETAEAKSVAEQVEEQVAQLRAQLEEQHSLSQQQLETLYNNRTNLMKQKLNQKLRDDKDKFKEEGRQEALVKHSEELQKLRQEHEATIVQLKEEHRLEVERLTKEGQLAVDRAQAKEQPEASSEQAPSQPPTNATAATTSTSTAEIDPSQLTFTDEQARTLVGKNTVIRGIVARNIQNKIAQETAKLKEEHEKVLQEKAEEAKKEREQALQEKTEEAKKASEQALSKAVNMETIKQKAKLGMAEGQTRAAKAKLEVVEKAATETPQRPVVEVWEVAKIAKPAPAVAAQVNKPPAQSPMSSPFKATGPGLPQSPGMAPPQATQSGQPTPNSQAPQDKMQARMQKFGAQTQSPQQGSSFGQPSFSPNQTSSEAQPQATVPPSANNSMTQSQGAAGTPPQTPGAPLRQVPGQQAAGPGPVRVPSLSGIPSGIPTGIPTGIPRGGGSMLPRGGGAFRGRGGLVQPGAQNAQGQGISVQGAAGQTQRGGLPRGGGIGRGRGGGRGGMNPGAQQFAPGTPGLQGNKRPHEGGDEGAGKRMRGGAGGGA